MDKTEFLKFLDVVEIFTMKDIMDVFGLDHHTFKKYLGEGKRVGKKRGLSRDGRKFYSVEDISSIMNMNKKGVKVFMFEYYIRNKKNLHPTKELWLDIKRDLIKKEN